MEAATAGGPGLPGGPGAGGSCGLSSRRRPADRGPDRSHHEVTRLLRSGPADPEECRGPAERGPPAASSRPTAGGSDPVGDVVVLRPAKTLAERQERCRARDVCRTGAIRFRQRLHAGIAKPGGAAGRSVPVARIRPTGIETRRGGTRRQDGTADCSSVRGGVPATADAGTVDVARGEIAGRRRTGG